MNKKKRSSKLTTNLPPGRKRFHGGYAFLTTGRLPEHRKYVLQYLTGAREQLVKDVGGDEQNLSAQQIIIIDRVIVKLGVLRCIEEHVKEMGVFQHGRLNSALSKNFLGWANSVRLDLQALGLNRRAASEVLDLGKYIEQKDKEKAEFGTDKHRGEVKDGTNDPSS
jgi:hypothetical protein